MPKPKRHASIQRRPVSPQVNQRQAGLLAFHANRLAEAIRLWTPLAVADPAVQAALAEAYFRRALADFAGPTTLDDLRQAVALAPNHARYHFHLGRRLHQLGEPAAAATHYRSALQHDPALAEAARLLALVSLEQNPQADLTRLPGAAPAVAQALAPAQALLRGSAPPAGDDSPPARLWHGLAQLAAGSPDARATLADDRPLPGSRLKKLRRYYQGVAAARAGDVDAAIELWQQDSDAGAQPAHLHENLAVGWFEQLRALRQAGDVDAAAALALRSAGRPGSVAFDELRLLALDAGAHAAATSGAWARASELWEAARALLAASAKLGSPRPLLHNLALAYERQQLWLPAAEAWRAMLRTRPRRQAAAASPPDPQWAWVRARIIDCYKRAGRPDEAVAVFRQMIKDDPSDLDNRIQLADALLANEQQRAAANEIQRVLEIDPQHVEALLRQVNLLDADRYLGMSEQIMRELAARHPERQDLRQRAAQLFLEHGRQYAEWHSTQQALQCFVEGEQYDPANYLFPLNQARMQIGLRNLAAVGPLVERAIALVGDQAEPYAKIVETWVIADQIDAARALIERMEQNLKLTSHSYLDLGMTIITRVAPPPAPLGLYGFFGTPPPRPAAPADTPWTRLAIELLDRAIALDPQSPALYRELATVLLLPRPDLAVRYAEAGVRQAPGDPEPLIALGLAQGANDQTREAKATLQQAIQLARKQRKPELIEHAQAMRQLVGTPMLRAALQASAMGMGPGAIDDDFGFDDMEDFFG